MGHQTWASKPVQANEGVGPSLLFSMPGPPNTAASVDCSLAAADTIPLPMIVQRRTAAMLILNVPYGHIDRGSLCENLLCHGRVIAGCCMDFSMPAKDSGRLPWQSSMMPVAGRFLVMSILP